jgi:transposase
MGRPCRTRSTSLRVGHLGSSATPRNRYLRAALYMPALVAIQHEPNVKAFYNKLVAAGKKPMQAVVAVMRKLLHVIWGMLKHDQDFDGNKFSDSPKQFLDRKKSI